MAGLSEFVGQYAAHGYATFPTVKKTKAPAIQYSWKEAGVDCFCVDENYPDGCFGVVLKADDLVVDLDPRNMQGRKVWSELKDRLGLNGNVENTMTVKTGSGGLHLYLKKPVEFRIRKSLEGFPGIDFLTEGCYVIGAGSQHSSGKTYDIIQKPFKYAVAPKELLNAIQKIVDTPTVESVKEAKFRADQDNKQRYIDFLKVCPVAIEGQQGDGMTYKIACHGRDFNLPPETCYELMAEHYNPRCQPEWPTDLLWQKVRNAYSYAEGIPGKDDPVVVFDKVEVVDTPDDKEWAKHLDRTQAGGLKNTLRNGIQILKHDPELCGRFSFNLFTNQMIITGSVPWDKSRVNVFREVTDNEVGHLSLYVAHNYNVEISNDRMWRAVDVVASYQSFHPVRDEINAMKWDGVPRLENWLTTYCGVASSEYVREVGKLTLVGMIARIFNPGCKFDYVLILEGGQGIGKSTVCSILGGRWFGDMPFDITSKDTVDYIHSRWILELSELVAVKKSDLDRLKNFISRTEDSCRPAYARATKRFPRQCIFIGTINPDGAGYLVDQENRRFWPVTCTKIDIEGLRRDRDQLLAEAREVFMKGELLYLRGTAAKEAQQQTLDRLVKDPWFDIIVRWTEANKATTKTVSTEDIYQNVLNGSFTTMTTYHQRRIAAALQRCGWVKRRGPMKVEYIYIDYVGAENEPLVTDE